MGEQVGQFRDDFYHRYSINSLNGHLRALSCASQVDKMADYAQNSARPVPMICVNSQLESASACPDSVIHNTPSVKNGIHRAQRLAPLKVKNYPVQSQLPTMQEIFVDESASEKTHKTPKFDVKSSRSRRRNDVEESKSVRSKSIHHTQMDASSMRAKPLTNDQALAKPTARSKQKKKKASKPRPKKYKKAIKKDKKEKDQGKRAEMITTEDGK